MEGKILCVIYIILCYLSDTSEILITLTVVSNRKLITLVWPRIEEFEQI